MNAPVHLSDLIAVAFAPLRDFLNAPDTIEICINKPGVVFVERAQANKSGARMTRHVVRELTGERIRFMAERIAAASYQFINEEEPLLSAALPGGARVQVVLPPAALDGGAIVIRKQVARQLSLANYAASGALRSARVISEADGLSDDEQALCELLARDNVETFLREAMRRRVSMMISGGTGSGKTTFLNAVMQEIPSDERIVTIEDTPELMPPQDNHVRLIASRGNQSIARIDPRHLVEASLRMRPDRLLLGEVRGSEALDFLQAINTGHPGSLSTVHANSPRAAYTRLALLVMQNHGGIGLSKAEIIETLRTTLPLVVQPGRRDGRPGVVCEIFYDPYVRSRQGKAALGEVEPSRHARLS